jgi:hypothetical protein
MLRSSQMRRVAPLRALAPRVPSRATPRERKHERKLPHFFVASSAFVVSGAFVASSAFVVSSIASPRSFPLSATSASIAPFAQFVFVPISPRGRPSPVRHLLNLAIVLERRASSLDLWVCFADSRRGAAQAEKHFRAAMGREDARDVKVCDVKACDGKACDVKARD